MKISFKYIIPVFALLVYSCSKMDEYKKFVPEGETIYAPVPMNIQVFPGDGRIKLKWHILNPTNVASCGVEYGDSASKKIIPVTLHAPKDSVEVIFDHLEEKSYLFYIYELDKNGNRSVKVQVTGTVYGEKYLSSITNRFISEITTSENAAIIKWALAGEGYVGSEITYKDQDGNSITRKVSADSDTTVIENWESMGNLSYRSFYKPEAQALDQFARKLKR